MRRIAVHRLLLREHPRSFAGEIDTQITYKAIEFGRRARVMATAEKTLHNHYGDRKDLSLLL